MPKRPPSYKTIARLYILLIFNRALVHNFPESGLGVYVTTDGVVYKDQVEEAATLKKKDGFAYNRV